MKKEILAIATAIAMAVTFIPIFAFATEDTSLEETEVVLVDVEDVEDAISDIVDMDEVDDNIEISGDGYEIEGEDVEFDIPEDGSGEIIMEQEESAPISMELPQEIAGVEGELTDSGTVIYDSEAANISVGIQALSGGEGETEWNAIRALIEIDNNDAGKEYVFKYNLPDGYKLISAEEWYNEFVAPTLEDDAEKDYYYVPGEIYVIDNDGAIVESVDPAWAKDANGEAVPTRYEIRGNELVQVVEFDENSAFPIIADPTKHPNKIKTYYLTKSQVKKVRDNYAYTSNSVIVSKGIVCLATGVVPSLAAGWTIIFVANDVYDNSKKSTWNKLYNKFPSGKKYLKVTGTWKWHGGHKTYYPTGKLKTSYVKSK